MTLLAWDYLEKHLEITGEDKEAESLAKKLNLLGLECEVKIKNERKFLEFVTFNNRPDLLTLWGIIREIGLITNHKIKLPKFAFKEKETKNLNVKINSEKCKESYFLLINYNKLEESNETTKKILLDYGISSENIFVDLAKLVYLETGQKINIFEQNNFNIKEEILVREGKSGERFFINKNKYLEIESSDIVIEIQKKIISVVGILQNKSTEISEKSEKILIESSYFEGINSKEKWEKSTPSNYQEVVKKYEKTKQVNNCKIAFEYYLTLLLEQKILNENNHFSFSFNKKRKKKIIAISDNFISKKTGVKIRKEQIENIWKKLDFICKKKNEIYYLSIPEYRIDIRDAQDLLEELLRVFGYGNIESKPIINYEKENTREDDWNINQFKGKIRNYLISLGWQEIITYSLVAFEEIKQFNDNEEESFYKLENIKNEKHVYYRQSLITNHIKIIKNNWTRGAFDLFFFEISKIFSNKKEKKELLTISGVGNYINYQFLQQNEKINLTWIKGIVENILKISLIENDFIKFNKKKGVEKSYDLFLEERKIADFFIVEKENKIIYIAEISLNELFENYEKNKREKKYKSLSDFPSSERHVSLIVEKGINNNLLVRKIKEKKVKNLTKIIIIDVFQNDKLEKENKKSITLKLTFQGQNQNLKKEEIELSVKEIIWFTNENFNAQVN